MKGQRSASRDGRLGRRLKAKSDWIR